MPSEINSVISEIPCRMALAGGWIDQPFVSRLNPSPPGSMELFLVYNLDGILIHRGGTPCEGQFLPLPIFLPSV